VSITPPKPKDELALAAAHLSRAAPNSWADFVKAFEVYMRVRKDECVQAPADRVLLAQGRAQQCVELSSLFTNAVATANAATQK
jgi:hypothetical protein